MRISLAMVTAIVLVGSWLLLAPRSPDFAAQTYRAALFERFGFTIWDNNWYGGHHLPGYSLVFPWLALLLGIRLAGALAVLVSTFAFERIALGVYGPRARWGAACFALAAAGDLWIGRVTFALGVTFAVLAVLALVRERPWLAVVLTVLCAATSPVAGLLLALAGATQVLVSRRALAGLTLVLPVLVVVLPLEALFPEGGWEPFAASSIIATVAVTLAFLYAVPWEERLLRIGALIYLGVTFLSIAPTPMGSNIARYAVILAGPLALCVLGRDGFSRPGRPLASVVLAVGVIVVWTAWGPVRESAEVIGDPSTSAAYYVPLERFLDAHGGSLVRVEVPFTHSHWEAAFLAQRFSLARGWERQLDTKYDPLFFGGTLTASAYRAWLKNLAVSYVALPDVRLDGSSDEEAALIRKGSALPARSVLEQTLARVQGDRCRADRLGACRADWAGPRLVHVALCRGGALACAACTTRATGRSWTATAVSRLRPAVGPTVSVKYPGVVRVRGALFARACAWAGRLLWMTTTRLVLAPFVATFACALAIAAAPAFARGFVPGPVVFGVLVSLRCRV